MDNRQGATAWLKRGRQVAGVLARLGLGHWLSRHGFRRWLPWRADRDLAQEAAGLPLPVRLRVACEELGPVTTKLGQALGNRPDLLGPDYVAEFGKLQDQVPPTPLEEARGFAEEELEGPLEEKFATFEPTPVAAASIAQVYAATLHSGEHVAVKVQRPGIERTVEIDLQVLHYVTETGRRHLWPWWPQFVEEFSHNLRQEMDFEHEGRNTDRLRQALSSDANARVPRVHWSLTRRRVLTLEWMGGVAVTDEAGLRELGVDRPQVAARLAQSMLRQILILGLFHADPHAGNILVQRDGRVVLLDCGHVVSTSADLREALGRLVLATLDEDAVDVCDELLGLGIAGEDTDLQRLREDVARVISRYAEVVSGEAGVGEALGQLLSIISRHHIMVPAAFVSMLWAIILLEGTCLQLDPHFDLRQSAAEVAREVARQWAQPSHVLGALRRGLRDLHRYSVLLPRQVSEVLAKAQSGGLRIKVESFHIHEPLRRLDIMCNRVAFALVVAAIIVGSSIMIASGRMASFLSTNGALAYGLVGAAMGLYLLYSIIRSGRL